MELQARRVAGFLRLRILLLVVLIAASALPAAGQAQAQQKWQGSFDALGRAGSENGGQLDLFAPLYQNSDTLLFGNAIGALDSDTSDGANFGGGIRHIFNGSYILGAYGYFDWLHSPNDNTFYQVSGGVEAMTADWDFRLNGYLPVSGSQDILNIPAIQGSDGMLTDPVIAIQNNEIGLLRQSIGGVPGQNGLLIQEAPLGGIEGEVGYRLPFGNALGSNTETRIFLGGYAFWGDGYPTYAGPRGRIEFRIYDLPILGEGSRLTAGGELAWDDPRGVTGEGSLRLRIPLNIFGGGDHPQLSDLDRRMVDPVPIRVLPIYGQRDIVTPAAAGNIPATTFEAVDDTETGREIDSIYFATGNGTSGNTGKQGDATDLTDAIGRAGGNGLIVLTGSGGSVTGHFGLMEGQILLGGASSLQVTGVTSNVTLTYTPGLTRPTIVADSMPGINVLGNNANANHIKIQGVDIDMTGNSQSAGIDFADSSNNIVRDVTTKNGFIGIGFEEHNAADSGNDLVDGATISGAVLGVVGQMNMNSGQLSNLTLDNITLTGIVQPVQITAPNGQFVDGVTINNMKVHGSYSDVLIGNTKNIMIDGLTVDTPADVNARGLTIQGISGSNNITVKNVTLTGLNIGIDTSNISNATFDNVTIGDSLTSGFIVDGGSNVSITNSTISGTGTMASPNEFAVSVSDVNGLTIQNVAVDGMNSGGTDVTDVAFQLQAITANTVINSANSTGNTVINTTTRCDPVSGGGHTIIGFISITTPAASTCP